MTCTNNICTGTCAVQGGGCTGTCFGCGSECAGNGCTGVCAADNCTATCRPGGGQTSSGGDSGCGSCSANCGSGCTNTCKDTCDTYCNEDCYTTVAQSLKDSLRLTKKFQADNIQDIAKLVIIEVNRRPAITDTTIDTSNLFAQKTKITSADINKIINNLNLLDDKYNTSHEAKQRERGMAALG